MQNFSRLKLRQTKNKSVGPPLPFPLKDVFVDFISIKKPEKLLFIFPVASECLPCSEKCLFNLLQKLDTIQKEQFNCIKFLACDKGEESITAPVLDMQPTEPQPVHKQGSSEGLLCLS